MWGTAADGFHVVNECSSAKGDDSLLIDRVRCALKLGRWFAPIGTRHISRYSCNTALEAERNASLCSFGCDTGGSASQPSQPNGNLLLLGSFRGQPETCLGFSVF